MKHILVVGGFMLIPQKIKNYDNVKMTLLIEASEVEKQDLSCFHRIVGVPNGSLENEWINIAQYIHKIDPITSIGAYHELDQEKASEIAKKIGVQFHDRKTIDYTRDKFLMRKLLRQAGLDPTESMPVANKKDIQKFAETYGFPIILKPQNGWASRGVSIIRSKKDIEDAIEWFHNLTPDSPMYVEQYLEGDEFSVEAFSEDGNHKIICITRQFNNNDHMIEVGHVLPASLDTKIEQQIKDFVTNILNLLGVKNGGSHTEIILTKEGPRAVESHARLAGDFIPELIQYASGIDFYDIWARQTIGEKVFHEIENINFTKFSSIRYKTPEALGTLIEVKGIEIERQKEGIKRIYVRKPGTKMQGVKHSFTRASYVISTGETETEAVERALKSSENLRFSVEC